MEIIPVSSAAAITPALSSSCGRSACAEPPSSTSGSAATDGAAAGENTDKPAARLLNPQPVIDPALGIVVTEYFNQAGQMTAQYPSAKIVDSYRIYGMHEPAGASASLPSNHVS